MPAEIIAATLAEMETAASLRAAMAREMGNDWDRRYPGWQARFATFWGDKQRAGRAQIYFARRESETAGMAIASIAEDYREAVLGIRRGYVNGVYVVPEHRRAGIGRALMLTVLQWFRARGCMAVRLRASDEGRQLYAELGFEPGREMDLTL